MCYFYNEQTKTCGGNWHGGTASKKPDGITRRIYCYGNKSMSCKNRPRNYADTKLQNEQDNKVQSIKDYRFGWIFFIIFILALRFPNLIEAIIDKLEDIINSIRYLF